MALCDTTNIIISTNTFLTTHFSTNIMVAYTVHPAYKMYRQAYCSRRPTGSDTEISHTGTAENSTVTTAQSTSKQDFSPRADIARDDHNIFLFVEIPGMGKDDITLSYNNEDRFLVVRGEKKAHSGVEGLKTLRHERQFGSFERKFKLSGEVNIDISAINAQFENGLLTITLPKIQPKTTTIPIV